MITSSECYSRYGSPEVERNMSVLYVPPGSGVLPARIYMNNDMHQPFTKAVHLLKEHNLLKEIKTFDGCFNIRRKNHAKTGTLSLHSWGLAIDLNAAWNRLGQKPTLSPALVNCFVAAGFEWGGNWRTPDGMHFQLKSLPNKPITWT